MTDATDVLADLIDWWHGDDPDERLLSLQTIINSAKAVLADNTEFDVVDVRDEIARLSGLARAAFGDKFHFATVTIWGADHRGRNAACGVTLHIHHGSKSFAGASPAEAIADAERFVADHNPADVEATGWAILGVVRA